MLNGGDIIGEAPVDLSWDTDFVSVSPSESLSAVVPKVADTSTVSVDIHWYKESFDAPIKKEIFSVNVTFHTPEKSSER